MGLATIVDDDAAPRLSITDVTHAEGDSGTTNFVFTVTLSSASAQTVTVAYATTDGNALKPGDYSVYLLEDDSYRSLAGGDFTVRG